MLSLASGNEIPHCNLVGHSVLMTRLFSIHCGAAQSEIFYLVFSFLFVFIYLYVYLF